MEVVVARVAGLDVHKDTVMAAVRVPGKSGSREQQVRQFRTFTRDLRALREWLVERGVTLAVMEATGVYWRPVWHALEEGGAFELKLVNAHHVKRVPGRKTDVSDAAWLAQLAECGLLQGSFVPPREIAQLRDLTRYRKKLVEDRAKEAQRIQKLLEDAGIKLDSVVTDILGMSARAMLEGLIRGDADTGELAELALGRMRPKIPELRLALEGAFGDHHRFLLQMILDHVEHLTAAIDQLDVQVAALMAPFAEPLRRLCTIPGIGRRSAEVILSEIGVDMTRFATAGHLASWAGMCPGNHESAGKRRTGRARKGNGALRSVLCEVAWAAARTKNTYLSAQFKRFCRRFGKDGTNKAVFALGHTILVIIWNVLEAQTDYNELGSDYFERRRETDAYRQRLVRQLEKLGHRVILEPAA